MVSKPTRVKGTPELVYPVYPSGPIGNFALYRHRPAVRQFTEQAAGLIKQ